MPSSKAEQIPGTIGPGKVTFLDGRGELPMLEVSTVWSTAEIYLQGAHVTHFKKKNDSPLLFLSQCSRFAEGQPIRGGIPVVFPWFGPREGLSQHGFAPAKGMGVEKNLRRLLMAAPACDFVCRIPRRLRRFPPAPLITLSPSAKRSNSNWLLRTTPKRTSLCLRIVCTLISKWEKLAP